MARKEESKRKQSGKIEIYQLEDLHNLGHDLPSLAERAANKSRQLLNLGNTLINEQEDIRNRIRELDKAGSKDKRPEISSGMHLAATQAYQAAAIYELARAVYSSSIQQQQIKPSVAKLLELPVNED